MNESSATAPPPAATPVRPVRFTGRRGEIAGVAVVNTLLTAITFSIYRFWAKTRLRRFYWQAIEIDGDPLEYTGSGLELLLGFLIVVALFIPVSMLVGGAQLFLALQSPALAVLPNLLMGVAAFWLWGYAMYRARRYRLTRTLWRGIRFGQDGSPARYAWMRFGWLLLMPLTLGILYPWYQVSLQRYAMRNTRFGFTRFNYAGTGRALFRWWWPVLLAGAVFLGALIVALVQAERVGPGSLGEIADHSPLAAVAAVGAILAFLGLVVLQTRYRVASLRYLFDVSSLAGVTARSHASTRRVILYALILAAFGIVTVGALIGFFAGTIAAVEAGHVSPAAIMLPVLLYLVAALLLSMVYQILFVFPLVRHVATTVETSDLGALAGVVQGTRDDPRFGEGLLDALDVDLDVV
jgi:uncharacterized membrane protein YjgN (DUF898 family)